MHFFRDGHKCSNFLLRNTELGNTDADWIIFDTCYSLRGSTNDLKYDLVGSVPGQRCAHMFLGFDSTARWPYPDNGEYFAQRLKKTTIQQAWFDYCKDRQPPTTYVRVFYAEDCNDESLAGPGPIEIRRDPTKDSPWTYEDYPPPP